MTSTTATDLNYQEVRYEITWRTAVLTAILASLVIWWRLLGNSLPDLTMLLWVGMIALGIGAYRLNGVRPQIARPVLIWGLTLALLITMMLYPAPWIPFAALPLLFISIMLVKYSEWVISAIVIGYTLITTQMGLRSYPVPELPLMVVVVAVAARICTRGLYSALEWSWIAQSQAREMLELARNRQEELNQTLKSLELAYSLQRRTQRELYYARKQAEEAKEAKEKFAANISHELRTPLNLILGFSEVMYMSPGVYGQMQWPPSLLRDVHYIYRNSRHLLEMIDDILDLAHLDMTEFSLNREATSVQELIMSAADIARDLFRVKPVALQIEIAEDIPPVEIDRTRIRQVLLNLLNNAQRYTHTGAITIAAKIVGKDVVISVQDTGAGIPADKLPYLFDEFYQADRSLRRSNEGVGLGLAICKHFVEAHQGRIWVESEVEVGSTFSFTIPIQSTVSSYVGRDVPLEPTRREDRASVLVIDPDPRVAALIGRHVDVDAVQVREPRELADEITLRHPQAVICNTLPGTEVDCASVLDDPVLSITCSLPSQSWIARDLGVSACLTKPVSAEELQLELTRLQSGDQAVALRHVLVIDDDRGFCHLVERLVKSMDGTIRLDMALDGAEGLDAMREQIPDLVLLDLMMPGRDGFQVLEEMRHDPQLEAVPVILLTATSYGEDALNQRSSRIVIERAGGLRPAEVLRCLHAVLGELQSEYEVTLPVEANP